MNHYGVFDFSLQNYIEAQRHCTDAREFASAGAFESYILSEAKAAYERGDGLEPEEELEEEGE